jgi:hypothetical protein
MVESDQRALQDEVARLRKQLEVLGGDFPDAVPERRSTILRTMWEVSGRIAEANVRSRKYESGTASDAAARAGAGAGC